MEKKVAISIKKASRICDKITEPQMRALGLTSAQFKILHYLYDHPNGTVRQVDMERFYSLTHPTTIGLLQALESKGYVVRTVNPDDARSRIVSLTEKAEEQREKLLALAEEIEETMTNNLNDKETEELVRLLEILLGENK